MKQNIFKTTDARGALILQGYKNVPVQISGLTPVFTPIYEVIPNGIYDDDHRTICCGRICCDYHQS